MNKNTKGISSQPHYIYWHDVDVTGYMNFAAIARYLQEAAWHSADQLGFGFETAKEMNQFWVLIKQWIKMDRFPKWKEKIVIETWPRGVNGYWVLRDYFIKDDKGETLGGVTSSWMLINTLTRRPERPVITPEVLPYIGSQLALEGSAPKIEFISQNEKKDSLKVRYSDMDLHGHVNNSRYIEWIFNALSACGLKNKYSSLQINHLAETVENDILDVVVSDIENTVFIKAEKRKDKHPVFIARLGF
ncbi:MAG: thioesterase [Bacteroidales bacterium]